MTHVRAPRQSDAAAIAALSGQLGYPADAAAVIRRLAAAGAADPGVSLVAEDAHGAVCGFARALPQHFITEEPFVELAALVVDDAARGSGVGKALLAAIEAWARQQGFGALYVRSNVVRERAHRFYLREGYAERKRQAVFFKAL